MSTTDMIRTLGAVSVLIVLLLMLTVTVLRLVAVPLVMTALVLDGAANLAARPLSVPQVDAASFRGGPR